MYWLKKTHFPAQKLGYYSLFKLKLQVLDNRKKPPPGERLAAVGGEKADGDFGLTCTA